MASIHPPISKATVLEALQAGVSNNTALIKEAEGYLKTIENSPAFHLTLIVSVDGLVLFNLRVYFSFFPRKFSQAHLLMIKSVGYQLFTSKMELTNIGGKMPPSKQFVSHKILETLNSNGPFSLALSLKARKQY